MTRAVDGTGPVGTGGGGGVAPASGTDLSPWVAIASRQNLIDLSTTPGPQYTVNVQALVTGLNIPLLPGESIVESENGHLSTAGLGGGFVGDFDGPLVSGALRCDGLVVQNLSAHADAFCYRMVQAGGRPPSMVDCVAVGPAGALEINTVMGPSTVLNISAFGTGRGIVFRNGSVGECGVQLLKAQSPAPGFVAVEVESTMTVLGTIVIDVPSSLAAPGQSAIAISNTATVAAGQLIQVMAAKITGPGLLFRQDLGDMPVDDDRLLVSGSSSDNWVASIDARRTDLSVPLSVSYPAFPAAAPTPIPYSTGVPPEIDDDTALSSHWILVKDDPAPGDIYLEYKGAKANSRQVCRMQVLVDRNAGSGPINLMFERDTNPASDTWSTIPSTVHPVDTSNGGRLQVTAEGVATVNNGDRVRPASQNLQDAVAARIYDITITVRGV